MIKKVELPALDRYYDPEDLLRLLARAINMLIEEHNAYIASVTIPPPGYGEAYTGELLALVRATNEWQDPNEEE